MADTLTIVASSTGALTVVQPGGIGPVGQPGEAGAAGPAGAAGAAGSPGASAYAVAVANGYMGTEVQWLASLVGAAGDPGPAGADGAAGAAGPANTLSIGTVTTGDPGTSAAASITGTAPTQTLSLTIPRGDVGATGSTGATGATGSTGTQGDPGVGVPVGGTTGQMLAKASATDYDTTWTTPAAGGGTADPALSFFLIGA